MSEETTVKSKGKPGVKGKPKGNRFELLTAKLIIEAAGAPFDRKDCYRTPLSGGHEFAGASDLVVSPSLQEKFPFCVECKHRKRFRLDHVFGMNKDFVGYHQQVLEACDRERNTRFPMVVIRGNGGKIYASIPTLSAFDASVRVSGATVLNYTCMSRRWRMTEFDVLLQAIFNRAAAQTV